MKSTKKLLSFMLAFILTFALIPMTAAPVFALEASFDTISATERIGDTDVTFDYVRENGRQRILANDGVTEIWYAVNIGDTGNIGADDCTITFSKPVSVSINYGSRQTVTSLVGGEDYGWGDVIEAFDLMDGARVYFVGTYGVLDGVAEMGYQMQSGFAERGGVTATLEKVGISSPELITYDGSTIDWKTLYKELIPKLEGERGDFTLVDLNSDGIPELVINLRNMDGESFGGLVDNSNPDSWPETPFVPFVYTIMKGDKTVRGIHLSSGWSGGGREIHINSAGQLYFFGSYEHFSSSEKGIRVNADGAFEQTAETKSTPNPTITDQLTWVPYSESAFANALNSWTSDGSGSTNIAQPERLNVMLDKTVYPKNSMMTITVTGITQKMVDENAFFFIMATSDYYGQQTIASATHENLRRLTNAGTMTFQLDVSFIDNPHTLFLFQQGNFEENGVGIDTAYSVGQPYQTAEFEVVRAGTVPSTNTPAPTTPVVQAPTGITVNPTASTVYVNGTAKAFEAYNIEGSNYFKLRDIAFVLNGTNKQFEVGYDNTTKAITLSSNTPYTVTGDEMVQGDGTTKTAVPTASKIYLDGSEINFTVYNIGGNNFFKLADLMSALNVGVTYNESTRAIGIDTSKNFEGVITISDSANEPPEEVTKEPIEETVAVMPENINIEINGNNVVATLSNINIPETIAINQPSTEDDALEWDWGIYFSDGNAVYSIQTSRYKFPGDAEETLDRNGIVDTLQHTLWKSNSDGSGDAVADANVSISDTGDSITWTFAFPAGEGISQSDIRFIGSSESLSDNLFRFYSYELNGTEWNYLGDMDVAYYVFE